MGFFLFILGLILGGVIGGTALYAYVLVNLAKAFQR